MHDWSGDARGLSKDAHSTLHSAGSLKDAHTFAAFSITHQRMHAPTLHLAWFFISFAERTQCPCPSIR
eukprot:1150739-Pelagomonas_calceolata.AAC.3